MTNYPKKLKLIKKSKFNYLIITLTLLLYIFISWQSTAVYINSNWINYFVTIGAIIWKSWLAIDGVGV